MNNLEVAPTPLIPAFSSPRMIISDDYFTFWRKEINSFPFDASKIISYLASHPKKKKFLSKKDLIIIQ
jgi:hypothetical protein